MGDLPGGHDRWHLVYVLIEKNIMIDLSIGNSETITTGAGVAKNNDAGNILRFVVGEGLKATKVEGYIAGKAYGGALEMRAQDGIRIGGSGLGYDYDVFTNVSVSFAANSFKVGQLLPIKVGKGVSFTTNGSINPFIKDNTLSEGSSLQVLSSAGSAGVSWTQLNSSYISNFNSVCALKF